MDGSKAGRLIVATALLAAPFIVGVQGSEPEGSGDLAFLQYPYEYSGCDLVTTAIRIDMEAARAFVAPGFEPLDGGHMFNANPELVDTGTAMMVVSASACADVGVVDGPASFAYAWIDIEEPSVAGETSPSAHDGYDLIEVVEDEDHLTFLQQARLPVVLGSVSVEVTKLSPGTLGEALASVRIDGPDGMLAEIESVAGGSLEVGVTLANWHQTDEGVGLMHLDSASDVNFYLAKATKCTVADGSILAQLVGGTDCTAANGQGVIATGASSQGYLKFWPGIQVGAV